MKLYFKGVCPSCASEFDIMLKSELAEHAQPSHFEVFCYLCEEPMRLDRIDPLETDGDAHH